MKNMNSKKPVLARAEEEEIMSTEARAQYGFSRDMMTKLLKSGALAYTTDPLDKRIKWVKRQDVEKIVASSEKLQRAGSSTKITSRNIQTESQGAGGKAAKAKSAARSQTDATVQERQSARQRKRRGKAKPRLPGLAGLCSSDKELLRHLDRLRREHGRGDNTTPPVGHKSLAQACGISKRQAQICAARLILAGAIKRVRQDSGHPDITKRGTVYQIYFALI